MITVIGSANMDLIAPVPHLPSPGETVLGTDLVRAAGGKGANQAVAAARAGGDVWFVGRVGADPWGNELRRGLAAVGVHVDLLGTDPTAPTGAALILVDQAGENSIVVAQGANGRVTPADVDRAAGVIGQSGALLLQLEIPVETVTHAAELAREVGTTVILNPAPASELPPSVLRMVDIVVANESEVATLSGVGWPVDPASAARLLLEAGAEAAIVTLGPRGAVLVLSHQEQDIPAFQVDAVDSTGAGDAFVGNLAAALGRGLSLHKAARFATAAAALSVRLRGGQASMPSREATERLLRGEPAP